MLDGARPEVAGHLREHYRENKKMAPEVIAELSKDVGNLLVYLEPSSRRLSIRLVSEGDETKREFELSL